MSETATRAGYGVVTEPMTLRIERLLPGPIERVWAFLTDSSLRGRWLATGEMELRLGGRVELIWRNAELTGHRETPPEGVPEEHRLVGAITRLDPPRLLAFTWGESSEVSFELAPMQGEIQLVITHRRLPSRDMMLKVAAGWHAHLDILSDVARDQAPAPFWSNWQRLGPEYAARLPE